MNHDEQAEFFLAQSGEQVRNAVSDGPLLSLLASIAHSLASLNEKTQRAMDDEYGLSGAQATGHSTNAVTVVDAYGRELTIPWADMGIPRKRGK